MKGGKFIVVIAIAAVIFLTGCCGLVPPDIPNIGDSSVSGELNSAIADVYGNDTITLTDYDKLFDDSATDAKLFEMINHTEALPENMGKIYTTPRNREISGNWCDSDSGYSIYEKGGASTYNDECLNQNDLSELVCMDDFKTWMSYRQYCGEGCYNGACEPPRLTAAKSQCRPFISGQNNLSDESRVNVVFVGFNYQNKNDFIIRVNRSISWDDEARGIFAIEPFRSNRDRFNIFYIDKLFDIDLGTMDRSEAYGTVVTEDQKQKILYYDNEISSACGFHNRITIGLLNEYGISYSNVPNLDVERYTGAISNSMVLFPDDKTAEKISKCDSEYTCSWYKDFYLNKGSPMVTTHEFGHAFSGLNDEYDLQLLAINSTNKYANCIKDDSINNVQQCLRNAPWVDLIGRGCGDPKKVDCSQDDPNYELEVSCYEGCDYQSSGVFRPTFASLMSTSTNRSWFNDETNLRVYGPVNERIHCCRLLYYTGEAGGTCMEYNKDGLDLLDFCSKYDNANELK